MFEATSSLFCSCLRLCVAVCCGTAGSCRRDRLCGDRGTYAQRRRVFANFGVRAYFDDLASRSQALSDPAPGNAGFIDNGGSVTLIDTIRPHSDIPLSGDGRARQTTTLTIEDTLSIALGDGSVRSVVVNISADVWQRAYALQNRHLSADGKGGGM